MNKRYNWVNKRYRTPLQRQADENKVNLFYEVAAILVLAVTWTLMVIWGK